MVVIIHHYDVIENILEIYKIVGYEIFVNKVLYTYKFINAYNLIIEVGY